MKPRTIRNAASWIVVSLLALNSILFLCEPAKAGHPEQMIELLDRFRKNEKLRKLELLDGAIIITHRNKTIYQSFFGFKKNKLGEITANTLFPLASSSKPFSAALVASLIKHEQVSWDDSVNSVITGIDSRVKLIHILSHSSGYNDTLGNKAIELGQNRDKIIHLFDGKRPESQPGSKYVYSNVIFSLLEDVIRLKTHSSYEQNMTKFLSSIGIEGEEICNVIQNNRVAFPHRMTRNQLTSMELPKKYTRTVCSAAGLYLSVDQVSHFLNLMLGHFPGVLNNKDLEVLFQPRVPVTDIFTKWNMRWPFPLEELKSYYALGWRVLKWKDESRFIFHSGHLNGITSFIGLVPEKDLGIAILSNQDVVFSEPLGMDFWKYSMDVSTEN